MIRYSSKYLESLCSLMKLIKHIKIRAGDSHAITVIVKKQIKILYTSIQKTVRLLCIIRLNHMILRWFNYSSSSLNFINEDIIFRLVIFTFDSLPES
jgi:hypothetical protein